MNIMIVLLFSIMTLLISGIVSLSFTIPLIFAGIQTTSLGRDHHFIWFLGLLQIVIAVIQGIVAITNIVFSCPIVCCRQMIQLDSNHSNGKADQREVNNCEDDLPSYDQTCVTDQKVVELDFDGKTGLIVDSETNKTCIV